MTDLLRVSKDVRRSVYERKVTILILFDFNKAFNAIPHFNLLKKLRVIGFSAEALTWVHLYLTERSQVVVDLDVLRSSQKPSTCGVPQGSVLGPLFFFLFIKEITTSLTHSNHLIFTDDTQIYLSCYSSQICDALGRIVLDTAAVAPYAVDSELSFNLAKSKVLIMGSSRYITGIYSSHFPPIVVNEIPLPFVSQATNLGVIIRSNLSWRVHITLIPQKVNYSLYELKHHRNSLSEKLKIKFISVPP